MQAPQTLAKTFQQQWNASRSSCTTNQSQNVTRDELWELGAHNKLWDELSSCASLHFPRIGGNWFRLLQWEEWWQDLSLSSFGHHSKILRMA